MFEGTINIKWFLMLLLQLGGGIALLATQGDNPALQQLGIGLIGSAIGQGASFNSSAISPLK